jgi:hypothetical protein
LVTDPPEGIIHVALLGVADKVLLEVEHVMTEFEATAEIIGGVVFVATDAVNVLFTQPFAGFVTDKL